MLELPNRKAVKRESAVGAGQGAGRNQGATRPAESEHGGRSTEPDAQAGRERRRLLEEAQGV